MNINKDRLGFEYVNELLEIIKIRKDRRILYKDSFLQDSPNFLLTILEGKINRYKVTKNKQAKIDDLRDAVNYLIFLICVIKK